MKICTSHDVSLNRFEAWTEVDGEYFGPIVYGQTNDDAIFRLGFAYGTMQQKWARPLDMIVPVEN
jgi:hypothetical protein